MTTLYLDNDVISKLASCDLLDEAIEALNSQRKSVRILSTFKHRFGITNARRRAQIEQEVGSVVFGRIEDFQRSVGEIPVAPHELVLAFEDLPAVDAGEAQLFASASTSNGVLVVTGDKRSIRCLASARECAAIARSLKHRVVCFEQVLLRVIRDRGFEHTKRKVVPAVDCDTALRAVFGMGLDAEEANVIRALDGYVESLRRESGDLLWCDSVRDV